MRQPWPVQVQQVSSETLSESTWWNYKQLQRNAAEHKKRKGSTVFRVEAADGPRRAPDRAAAAQDDPVDVERDAEGRPRRGRRGVGETLGEIRRPAVRRVLGLRPRPRPRRADQRKAEAPHTAPPWV